MFETTLELLHHQGNSCWTHYKMFSIDIDNDPELDRYEFEKVEVFPDEVGTLLKFKIDTTKYEVPEFAEVWVGVRDKDGNFVPGREPFAADNGDFTAHSELEEGEWAVYIPTGALGHEKEGIFTVFSMIVSEDPDDEDYGVAWGVAGYDIMISKPGEWDMIEWLRPAIDLCSALAEVSGFDTDEEFVGLAENFIDWFEFDDILEVAELVEALKNPSTSKLADAAMAIPLRMPEFVPENVIVTLLALFDIPFDGTAEKEAAFVKKVAMLYGMNDESWKDLVATFQEGETE
jgi:hypothetical protein